MIFLILSLLAVTARFERAWSTEEDGKSLRFVLNGDQTYFLVALTIKFRVHCFFVLSPAVFGFLVLNAWWRKRWLLIAPMGFGVILIVLQLAEMRLPSYLSQSQSVSLGWYLFPWSAAGLSTALSWLSKRLNILHRWRLSLGVVIACSFVVWQIVRGPGPIERKNFSESLVVSPDDIAALAFVRTRTPKDAVVLTALLQPNHALWSGIGGLADIPRLYSSRQSARSSAAAKRTG